MAAIAGHHKIASEICKALGIENATSLDIHMAANEVVTVTATFNAQHTDMEKIPLLLKKFKLVPIENKGWFATGGILNPDAEKYTKLVHE